MTAMNICNRMTVDELDHMAGTQTHRKRTTASHRGRWPQSTSASTFPIRTSADQFLPAFIDFVNSQLQTAHQSNSPTRIPIVSDALDDDKLMTNLIHSQKRVVCLGECDGVSLWYIASQ